MTLELYPDIIHEGDLSPDAAGDDINDMVDSIYKACKGFGTDEMRLIKELARTTPQQRAVLAMRYPEVHGGKELKKVMKSECGSRDFGTALQFLAVAPDVMECDMLVRAMKGIGTDERLVYSIICGRSNKEMEILKKTFYKVYEKDLGRKLDSELSGHFEKLIFNALQASEEPYDPDYHTDDKVAEDVEAFYKMGKGKIGTDESGFFKLLCSSPPEHLKKVNSMYADKHDVTLFHAVSTEFGGDAKDAALFELGMKIKPYDTVAKLIVSATKGLGTDEDLLTCTLLRYQLHLPEINVAYQSLTGKTIQETLKKEVSGDYRRLLEEFVLFQTP